MPKNIINKFKKEYGNKNGKSVYYATANKQKRNPETFEKLKETIKSMVKECIDEQMESDNENIHEKEEVKIAKEIIDIIDNLYPANGQMYKFLKIQRLAERLIELHS